MPKVRKPRTWILLEHAPCDPSEVLDNVNQAIVDPTMRAVGAVDAGCLAMERGDLKLRLQATQKALWKLENEHAALIKKISSRLA